VSPSGEFVVADAPPVTPLGLALGEPAEDETPGEVEIAPVFEPGEPGLPLMRPLAFGWRLASELPGLVTVEPPLESVPLGPVPLTLPLVPAPIEACACRLQSSKSA
jgi:hypothetical protein